jgi:hypothetical protein
MRTGVRGAGRDPAHARSSVDVMTSDVFVPNDEHRDEITELMRVAFNLSTDSVPERAAWLPIQKMRCVSDGSRVVAAAGARDFRQWFAGASSR